LDLRRTREYEASKAALDAGRRRELELVEESIAADPFGEAYRVPRFDGCTVDYSDEGLLVAYRVEGDAILLVDFVDP
jgi:hypothetical protein